MHYYSQYKLIELDLKTCEYRNAYFFNILFLLEIVYT